jgi:cytochrome c oxidase cbb3-type subunit III
MQRRQLLNAVAGSGLGAVCAPMIQKAWRLCLFAFLFAAAIAAARPGQDPIAALTADDLAHGKRLYVGQCALCHGIEGVGGRGPALNQPALRRAKDHQALYNVIRNGVAGTEMPAAWHMNDREAWRVVGYILSLNRVEAAKPAGDAGRGRELYRAKGCAGCHIIRGEGGASGPELTEIGARRSAAYLREALIDPAASVPEGFLVVGVITRAGRNLRGVRVNEDSFTIQLRDDEDRFHSFLKNELRSLKKEFGVSTMPSYKTLAATELDDLIAYLASLGGAK